MNARQQAHERWASCAHPLGSLGLLETALEDIAALTGNADIALHPRTLLVFCADNGVVAQGVTQTTSDVTAAVTRSLAQGTSSVSPMARLAQCEVIPVDVGIQTFPPTDGVLDRRVANGTADISEGPALSRQQVLAAIEIGKTLVKEQAARGVQLIALGEMGIGNTTTAAAVASVLLGMSPDEVTGRGAGLSDAGLARKKAVIARAISINEPDPEDLVDVMAKVGGADIAALCGACLGGHESRIPIVLDGAITLVGALCACRLNPATAQALLASHVSAEPLGPKLLAALGKQAPIHAGMRLGEGTGAVALLPLLDMALAVYNDAHRFEDCGIAPYKPLGEQPC